MIGRHQHIGRQFGQGQEVDILRDFEVIGYRDVDFRPAQHFQETRLVCLDQPDPRAGMGLLEGLAQGSHDQWRQGDEAAKRDRPPRALRDVAGQLVHRLGLIEDLFGLVEEAPPARRQRQALRVLADEELNAELLLQLGDRRGDRGRRDVHAARGGGDAAGLSHGDEILELSKGESEWHGRALIGLAEPSVSRRPPRSAKHAAPQAQVKPDVEAFASAGRNRLPQSRQATAYSSPGTP